MSCFWNVRTLAIGYIDLFLYVHVCKLLYIALMFISGVESMVNGTTWKNYDNHDPLWHAVFNTLS